MEPVTLERAVEVVRSLTPAEQRQLLQLMDSWQKPQSAAAMPEQERRFTAHLLAKGMITHIPDRYQEGYIAEDESARHPPIVLEGEPLSETIIRDAADGGLFSGNERVSEAPRAGDRNRLGAGTGEYPEQCSCMSRRLPEWKRLRR